LFESHSILMIWFTWRMPFRALRSSLNPGSRVWLYIPLAILFNDNYYTVKSIRGTSMQPTLNPEPFIWRDIVIFDRLSIWSYQDWERGDVVAIKSPTDFKLIVKRIIALEGDVVQTLPPYPEKEVRIPKGHAWVEGDEPFRTLDSNTFGPVPLGLLDSKLIFIIFPLNRFGSLLTPSLRKPNAPQGATWKKENTEVERERWRSSRVRVKPE